MVNAGGHGVREKVGTVRESLPVREFWDSKMVSAIDLWPSR